MLWKKRAEQPPASSASPFSVDVACAVIREGERILIAKRRKEDHLGGLWEFPGGKRIAPESLGACLQRELLEELGIGIKPRRFLKRIDYQYPEKRVSLYFYECELVEGQPVARASVEYRWVWPFELCRYSFPPANEVLLNLLRGVGV